MTANLKRYLLWPSYILHKLYVFVWNECQALNMLSVMKHLQGFNYQTIFMDCWKQRKWNNFFMSLKITPNAYLIKQL